MEGDEHHQVVVTSAIFGTIFSGLYDLKWMMTFFYPLFAGAVAVLLLLAVALLCAYELCAVYVTAGSKASERYSPSGFFFGVSAIALAINMLFICRMVFNGNGLDVDEYVRRSYRFAYSDCIEVGPIASLPEPPDPNDLYVRKSSRASHLGLLYVGSLVVLLVYSILYGLTAKESRWLGAITSAAVIVLDWNMGACLFGFELLRSRVAALFVAGASRVFLICFGVHYWNLKMLLLISIRIMNIIVHYFLALAVAWKAMVVNPAHLEKGLDPTILALLQRSSLDADRDHGQAEDVAATESDRLDIMFTNQISFSEELRRHGLGKWMDFFRFVLHYIAGTPERAWVMFSLIFILETVIVAIFRPKTIKVINATHEQFEFGFSVLLLSPVVCSIMAFLWSLHAEEMAMTSKPRKGIVLVVSMLIFTGSIIALVVLVTFCGASYLGVVNAREDGVPVKADFLAALLPLLCIPAVVSLFIGLYKWKDDDWNVSRGVYVFVGIGFLLLLGGISAVIVIIKPWTVGVAFLLVILLVILAFVVIHYWASNNFYLTRTQMFLVCFLAFLLALAAFFIGIFEGNPFVGGSVGYFSFLFLLAGRALTVLLSPPIVVYSPRVLPVYVYDAHADSAKNVSCAFLVLYGVALATEGWGVVASLLLYPPFAGAAVSAITLVVSFGFAVSRPCLTLKMMEDAIHFLSKDTVVQAIARSSTKDEVRLRLFLDSIVLLIAFVWHNCLGEHNRWHIVTITVDAEIGEATCYLDGGFDGYQNGLTFPMGTGIWENEDEINTFYSATSPVEYYMSELPECSLQVADSPPRVNEWESEEADIDIYDRRMKRRSEREGVAIDMDTLGRKLRKPKLETKEQMHQRMLSIELAVKEALSSRGEANFTDQEFPPSDRSLFVDPDNPPLKLQVVSQWTRPTDIVKESCRDSRPCLFSGPVNSSDVCQGRLGDCWFLSAVAVLTESSRISEVIITPEFNEEGVYTVRFCIQGEWVPVIVDDWIPCESPGKPAFATSRKGNELWVSILEKAYAKLHGSYEALEGGLVQDALVDLTGGAGEEIDMRTGQAQIDLASGRLWSQLLRFKQEGFLLGAGSPSGSDVHVSSSGIVQGHAYSLLQIRDVDGHKLLQIRNPWANEVEWNGPWSDSSPEWTDRMKHKLKYVPQSKEGIFWMSWQDFQVHFRSIYVCRLYPPEMCYSVHGQWRGYTAGGCQDYNSWHQNPQYRLKVTGPDASSPVHVFITLTQGVSFSRKAAGFRNFQSSHDSELFYIGMRILKTNGCRAYNIYMHDTVGGSDYVNSREISYEVVLEPHRKGYTIVPSTLHPCEEAPFVLSVFTKAAVTLEAL
ncbi:unnamed protein product [Spirodela intermedia]|uniref:Calpain catalytic domain-containing protein n=1 Tax=Spirodela intermedia TaxID=51605 RepID=A0A7I8JSE9_SPIIN|nr:unnamed protein product [Spirodela intermedia]CAA6673108.1 unnamed protein product [Spirodela intermedia]